MEPILQLNSDKNKNKQSDEDMVPLAKKQLKEQKMKILHPFCEAKYYNRQINQM